MFKKDKHSSFFYQIVNSCMTKNKAAWASVTRKLDKFSPNFWKRVAKIATSKLNLKAQNHINYF